MADAKKFGGFEIRKTKVQSRRLALLLWGAAGCGKTTLAATAPGKKLWILFDPDGDQAIANRDDVDVLDLTGQPHNIVGKCVQENPLSIEASLAAGEYDTVVVDSLSTFGLLALEHGVLNVPLPKSGKPATLEFPTLQGYGCRSTYVMKFIRNMMRSTIKTNTHLVFIAHNATDKDEDSGIILTSILLGGQAGSQSPQWFSEVWMLEDNGKSRRIYLRNLRTKKPMKTRMFDTRKGDNFVWNFDAIELTGEGISSWYDKWKTGEFKSGAVPLPVSTSK